MPAGQILIISKNNIQLTKAAVRTALDQNVNCDVMVIDNCSTDGTRAWLKTKPVAISNSMKERSLASCWNAGLKSFWTVGAEEVLVLNNDVEIRRDTYSLLRACQLPFVTCVSVNNFDQLGEYADRTVRDLMKSARPHPDFSCFMIKKSVFYKVGPFDEDFFPAYYEDNDYHVRMHRRGIKAMCVDLPFYHAGAQTIAASDYATRDRINRYSAGNRIKFFNKYKCFPATPQYDALFEDVK